MLSPSAWCSEKFNSAFNLASIHPDKNIILEYGYPRDDTLYQTSPETIEKLKEKLKLPKNKKIILYAPTWRDDQYELGKGYTFDSKMDFTLLKEHLSDNYIILFRAHYFVADNFNFEIYKNFIYDVSKIEDINELYLVSDMLITDYSSVFFDYANLNRPILFYMYDLP